MSLYSNCPPSLRRWILSQRPGVTESDLEREDSAWLNSQVVQGLQDVIRVSSSNPIHLSYESEDSHRRIQLAALYCGINPQYMVIENVLDVIYIILFIRKTGVVGLISQEMVDHCLSADVTSKIWDYIQIQNPYTVKSLLVMIYQQDYPEWAFVFVHSRYYANWLVNNNLQEDVLRIMLRKIEAINKWIEGNAFIQILCQLIGRVPISVTQAQGNIKYQTFVHLLQALAAQPDNFIIGPEVERLMIELFSMTDPRACEHFLNQLGISLRAGVDPVIYLRQNLSKFFNFNSLQNMSIIPNRIEYIPTQGILGPKKQILPWNLLEYPISDVLQAYETAIIDSTTIDNLLVINDEIRAKIKTYNNRIPNLEQFKLILRQAVSKIRLLINSMSIDAVEMVNLKIIISATIQLTTPEDRKLFYILSQNTIPGRVSIKHNAVLSQLLVDRLYNKLTMSTLSMIPEDERFIRLVNERARVLQLQQIHPEFLRLIGYPNTNIINFPISNRVNPMSGFIYPGLEELTVLARRSTPSTAMQLSEFILANSAENELIPVENELIQVENEGPFRQALLASLAQYEQDTIGRGNRLNPLDLINLTIPLNQIPLGQETCRVCLESLAEDEAGAPVALACQHVFHTQCIDAWLTNPYSRDQACPICREPVYRFR